MRHARNALLKSNQAIRKGTHPKPRHLDDGEVTLRIPTADMKVLDRLFPDLVSPDRELQLAAWKKLRHSPIGERYLVQRTPRQVKANNNRIIIR